MMRRVILVLGFCIVLLAGLVSADWIDYILSLFITVINVQSYPVVGGLWQVDFNTTGTADLHVTAINGTVWNQDLIFQGIYCGDSLQDSVLVGDSYVARDYSCDETGREVAKVLTRGKHTLHFQFGSEEDYAYNSASGADWIINSSGGNQTFTGYFDSANLTVKKSTNELVLEQKVTSGLVGHWTFDEGSGSTAYDESGVNNGTLTNMEAGDWISGKYSYALSFDGVDEYVDAQNDTSLDVTAITVMAWVKPNTLSSTWQSILSKGASYPNERYHMAARYDGDIYFDINLNTSGRTTFSISSGALVAGSYRHVAFTLNTTEAQILVGGVVKDTTVVSNEVITTDNNDLHIGVRNVNENKFNGTIDEVKIFNRVLTLAEINQTKDNENKGAGYGSYVVCSGSDVAYNVTAFFTNTTENYITLYSNGTGSWVAIGNLSNGTNLAIPSANRGSGIKIEYHTSNASVTPKMEPEGGVGVWCGAAAAACTTPTNDLYINANTTLCAGTYYLNDSGSNGVLIINASNIELDCNDATLIGNSSGYAIYWWGTTYSNLTFKDCNLQNYSGGIVGRCGYTGKVDISSSEFSYMANNSATTDAGIYVEDASNGNISDNVFISNDGSSDIVIRDSNYYIISDNTINNSLASYGIRVYADSDYNNVSGNTIRDITHMGIVIESNSVHNLVKNNYIENNTGGEAIIMYGSCNYTTIRNNTINHSNYMGIYNRPSLGGGNDFAVIEDNTLINMESGSGIEINGACFCNVTGNTINATTSTSSGIKCSGSTAVPRVTDNRFDNNEINGFASYAGIWDRGGCDNATFNNNTLKNNRYSILDDGSDEGSTYSNISIDNSTRNAIDVGNNIVDKVFRDIVITNVGAGYDYIEIGINSSIKCVNVSHNVIDMGASNSNLSYYEYLTFESTTDINFNTTVKWDNSSGDTLHTFTGGNLSKQDMIYFNQTNASTTNFSNKYFNVEGLTASKTFNVTEGGIHYTTFNTDASGIGGFADNVTGTVSYVITDTGAAAPDVTDPVLAYHTPTETNDTTINTNHSQINMSIIEAGGLDTFTFNISGPRNISSDYYGSDLVLALGLNNLSALNENGSKFTDISSSSNNGSCSGTSCPTYTASGKYGGAMDFDGVDDYINCGNDASLNITDAITIETWTKFKEIDRTQSWIAKRRSQAPWASYSLSLAGWSNELYCGATNDSNDSIKVGNFCPELDTWYHIALTVKANNKIRLYVDGDIKEEKSFSGNILQSDNNFKVGTSITEFFNGTIDEVRIYNRALSADEILLHYQSEFMRYNSSEYRFYCNLTNLTDGNYEHYGWANDTAGNNGTSEVRYLTVDTTYPSVTINQPTVTTYSSTNITLNTTISDTNLDVCWYSIDSWVTNTTFNCGQTTFIASYGSNTVNVAANDTGGNVNDDESVTFTVGTAVINIINNLIKWYW